MLSTSSPRLFIAESATLAHVVRPLTLATELQRRGVPVHFATEEKFRPWIEKHGMQFHPVQCQSPSRFLRLLEKGKAPIDVALLKKQVAEDLILLKTVQPEIVIGDFRLSLNVSARAAQIPYLGLCNAYWTTFTPKTMPVPEVNPLRLLGPQLARAIFKRVPQARIEHELAKEARGFNQIRQAFSQSPYSSIIHSYFDADWIGFADMPSLFGKLPISTPYSFIGPISGAPDCEIPQWWNQLEPDKKTLYLNFGSSGDQTLVAALLRDFAYEPFQWIVVAPERPKVRNASLFWAHEIPGHLACKRADLVICNGGAPAVFQALSAGKPVIGIAKNTDQTLNLSTLSDYTFVRGFRTWGFSTQVLRKPIHELLENEDVRQAALQFARTLNAIDVHANFEGACQGLLASWNRSGLI